MKISILLPYKENFSPDYPGAVSLFINDTTKVSKYKRNIKVYGSTSFKNKFDIRYQNIDLTNRFLGSQSKRYINKFVEYERKEPSQLIEIHNRPTYLKYILERLNKRTYAIFFHNDPLSMEGSKSVKDRNFLLKNAYKIIFNSNWSKNRFLEGLDSKYINSEKLKVFYQSAKKGKIYNLKNKAKWITFVGKLNRAKGYDIFGKAIIKVLNKYKDWTAKIVGDENREKLDFKH